jgi:hypothetical protein
MIFNVDKKLNNTSEKEKLKDGIENWSILFDGNNRNKKLKHICKDIDSVTAIYNDENLKKRNYGDVSLNENCKFDVSYDINGDDETDEFARTNAFGYILLIAPYDEINTYINSESAIGPCHYDKKEDRLYGEKLAEGTTNMLTKICILKKYDPNYLEKYLKYGDFDNKIDENKFAEEMARLLSIASIDFYGRDAVHQYVRIVNSEDGLNSDLMCSGFINSAINNDFVFEREYNLLSKRTYKSLCDEIDEIEDNHNKTRIYDYEMVSDCIEQVQEYYGRKVLTLAGNDTISDAMMFDIDNNFREYADESKNSVVNMRISGKTKHL